MNYKEIETENFDGTKSKHIIIDNGDGSFKSFPANLDNPEYVAFLEAQPKKKTTTKTTVVEEPVAPEEE
jgi:hypothetical protein